MFLVTVPVRASMKRCLPQLPNCVATARRNNSTTAIENVTVIGGGVMGAGIAHLCAKNQFNVTVVDTDEYQQKCLVSIAKSLDIVAKKKFPNEAKAASSWKNGILGNVKTTSKMEIGCESADLIIESVIENMDIKRSIYGQVDPLISHNAILASNTSSLSIEELSHGLTCGDRFAGLHFFNPVWSMKLVEIIPDEETTLSTVNTLTTFAKDLSRTPVTCPDIPGFIVNRLIYPYLMDALRFLERGDATVEDIDQAMKLGAGVPKGPFEIIDIIGLDTMQQVTNHWNKKFPDDPRYVPCDIINEMVREKKLGRKTSQGFYSYRRKSIY